MTPQRRQRTILLRQNHQKRFMAVQTTSSTAFTRNIVEGAIRLGVNKADLLKTIGISEQTLASPEARVSSVAHVYLLNEAVRLTGDEHFGLRAGSWISPDPANMIYYLFMHSPTFGEGVEISAKYFHQYSDSLFAEVKQEGDIVRVCLGSYEVLPTFPRQINEWILATWMAMARKFAGEDFSPQKVHFTNKQPNEGAVLRDFFRAPVEFNHPRTEMIYPKSAMGTLPQAGAGDLALREIMERNVQYQIEQAAGVDPFMRTLREEIVQRVAVEKIEIETIARTLGLSGRSLQRKLKEFGTTYRKVLDSILQNLAVDLLRDRRLSLGDVIHKLGFSSQAAFYRAFYRWFETTPAEFRRKLAIPEFDLAKVIPPKKSS